MEVYRFLKSQVGIFAFNFEQAELDFVLLSQINGLNGRAILNIVNLSER